MGLLSDCMPERVDDGMLDAVKPNIFNYLDFRKYLGDVYDYRHSRNRKYTKTTVCIELGIPNTRSYFNAVLRGRIVSKTKTEDFIRIFGLGKDEATYFRIMVNYQQATISGEERGWYLGQLLANYRAPEATSE